MSCKRPGTGTGEDSSSASKKSRVDSPPSPGSGKTRSSGGARNEDAKSWSLGGAGKEDAKSWSLGGAGNEDAKSWRWSLERLGEDIIQWCILVHLDARSLARCRSICHAWKVMSSRDLLWIRHCCTFFTTRAQLPRDLLRLDRPLPAMSAFNIVMSDSRKSWLLSNEVCGRTWELCVKPVCGTYWYALDPTTRGEPALARYFHCDGSLTADPGDPIWGGQESSWKFIFADAEQYIKINYWPMFNILRLDDGRWRLENRWATYTTQPDLHLGSGLLICKELAPSCSGCSYPRLRNALTKLVPMRNSLDEFVGTPAMNLLMEA